MTQSNDSVLVPAGTTGATIATHLAAGKEHQVMILADEGGHIVGSKDTYFYAIAQQVHVAVASTVHWDLFNADAALLVRVVSIKQIPDVSTTFTGIALNWLLERATAVGTGGAAQTAWLPDLSQTALDADITCRSKPTGGATQSTDLVNYWINADEANAGTIQLAAQNGLELVPEPLRQTPGGNGHGILLRPSQGLRCVQITSSNQGNTGWMISFTVE
jgi:hypothetical protein